LSNVLNIDAEPGGNPPDELLKRSYMTTQSTLDKKHEYQQKVKAELEKVNARIDQYQAKAREAKADTAAHYHDNLEQLIAKRDAAQSKLDELQQASGEAWEEVQKGFENAWNELSVAFQNATSTFDR
jgi:chromosome segregation ATPase